MLEARHDDDDDDEQNTPWVGGRSYSSAEMQYVYSAAPADWAKLFGRRFRRLWEPYKTITTRKNAKTKDMNLKIKRVVYLRNQKKRRKCDNKDVRDV